MPRMKMSRHICGTPGAHYFKPRGIPMRDLEVVVLEKDEFEALRLADALDLYHEEGAQRMKVSRQTFGLILKSARKKVAQTLIQGAALSIEDFQKKDQEKE